MSQINVNTIAPQSGSSVTVSGDISATNQTGSIGRIEGATINLTGDLTAKRYIVSSSVTELSVITNSGSTAFGDSLDDTHIYTGSLQLTGSVSASKFIGDGALLSNVFEGTAPSASISTRLTSFTDGTATSVSGSATSTGSFGRLEIAKEANIGGNLTVQGSNTSMIAGSLGVGTTATNQVNLSSVSTALTINGSSTSIIELAIGGARKANFYSDGTDATIANNSSGKFEFLTDNNYRMSILADGKVGIGTRSPGVELEVVGSISGSSTSTGSFGALQINGSPLISGDSDGIGIGVSNPNALIDLQDTYGTIHIGTTINNNPEIRLDGTGVHGANIVLASAGAGAAVSVKIKDFFLGQQYGAGGDFHIDTTLGGDMFCLTSGGKLGLGTNIPSASLHVVGNVLVDTHITASGNISGSVTSTGSFGHVFTNNAIIQERNL